MAEPKKTTAAKQSLEISEELDARLRLAAELLIDEFLRIDSMKDNDDT